MRRTLKMCAALMFCALLVVSAGCRPAPSQPVEKSARLEAVALPQGGKLLVIATTSIVGDLVRTVGGERIQLSLLLPLGTDPHSFDPTPRDVAALSEAHVLFANGAGLEEFVAMMIANARGKAGVIYVSEGVHLLESHGEQHAGETKGEGKEYHHSGADPHTWTSPANAIIFVQNIERALSTLDPAGASMYRANAESYTKRLQALDDWVREQISRIPPENRKLVTDHEAFGYYAERYGLEQVGFVFPGTSTLAEPSAADLAKLADTIRQQKIKAVFVGTTVNPNLAKRVAEDTGAKLVPLYTGSLGGSGSGVETYLDYVRYNTDAIVAALR